jgi:DNA-binding transcriptional LysR family regulator
MWPSSPCSVVDVDEELGSGEPQLHHRQQAVPAGDDARLRPQAFEQRDGVLDARRAFVLERDGARTPWPAQLPHLPERCDVGQRPVKPSVIGVPTIAAVTLTQLKVFVLVSRLGSVKAAATALGVSEPAVSQALTALRQSLGDPLLVRAGSLMELTPAGQRVVGIASQMVNLAVDAEAAVRQSHGAPELIRVVATSTIATTIAPALLQAFTAKAGAVELSLGTASTEEMAVLLQERLADVALGPDLARDHPDHLDSVPLLRYRLSVVASGRLAPPTPAPVPLGTSVPGALVGRPQRHGSALRRRSPDRHAPAPRVCRAGVRHADGSLVCSSGRRGCVACRGAPRRTPPVPAGTGQPAAPGRAARTTVARHHADR